MLKEMKIISSLIWYSISFASSAPFYSILYDTFVVYVKSNTLLGDNKHATGVVLSEIVAANIPVRNGVVHLIKRPLMIVDTTVTEFLQVSPNVFQPKTNQK